MEPRELIQYLPQCDEAHARRRATWPGPLSRRVFLDSHHSIPWRHAAVEGTPWKNAFFLEPLLKSHRATSVSRSRMTKLLPLAHPDLGRGVCVQEGERLQRPARSAG
jgi:hypothetical protein